MYYRSQGYPYKKEINLPPNYGGNAFFEDIDTESEKTEVLTQPLREEKDPSQEIPKNAYEEKAIETHSESATEAGLFKHGSFLGGKIGAEELLLLAVIFLISDSEGSDDILWLLILLLFIK